MSHRLVGPFVIALCFQSVVLFGQTASKTLLQTSSFNQQWLDVVVLIEVAEPQKPIRSIGTGFLVETPNKHVVVVTAKHVIQSPLSAGQRLGYRLNTSDGGSVIIWDDDLAKRGLGRWHQSATSDLACRFIAWPDAAKMVTLLPKDFIEDGVLTAGAPILVLGFPTRTTVSGSA